MAFSDHFRSVQGEMCCCVFIEKEYMGVDRCAEDCGDGGVGFRT
jgi:hypothetical protein